MTDNKWCYCQHSTTNFDDNCATWCNKHNARIFDGDATLCDGCKLFEQDDKRKLSYIEGWRNVSSPGEYVEMSVFSQTGGFYIGRVWQGW